MQNITIIDKASLNKINTDSSNILLDKVSIIQTKLHKDDIAEIIQNGNDLVIKLKNGETITLENYFVKDANGQTSDLVFGRLIPKQAIILIRQTQILMAKTNLL